MATATVLVIDDEQMISWSIAQTLRAAGYAVALAGTAGDGLAQMRQLLPEVVFLDVRLPDEDGLSVLAKIKGEDGIETAVIVMTAIDEIRTAVEAMRLGAFDYLKKPFDFDELEVIVDKALEATQLRRELGGFRDERKKTFGFDNVIGESDAMRHVLSLVERVADSDNAMVLLRGENGTGKDLIARAIHYRSRRADGPFMDISCTAMPETLFESELFGFEKGAFTDARTTKRGLIELADGGTLFLDEVGDMPLVSQGKFLKVIESRQFRRLGGTVDHRVDTRIVAATNVDLEMSVRQGRFREDLYYRLKVIPVVLPPLRARREDIPHLMRHFMLKYNAEFHKNFRQISPEALQVLMAYAWPGNVRELRNLIERVLILEKGDTIGIEHLPPEITGPPAAEHARMDTAAAPGGPVGRDQTEPRFSLPPEGIALEEVEKDLVRQSIELANGNQTRAAELLHISRDALRYRLQKFGLR